MKLGMSHYNFPYLPNLSEIKFDHHFVSSLKPHKPSATAMDPRSQDPTTRLKNVVEFANSFKIDNRIPIQRWNQFTSIK